jgi:putative addiction module component (TIGR02574 family)
MSRRIRRSSAILGFSAGRKVSAWKALLILRGALQAALVLGAARHDRNDGIKPLQGRCVQGLRGSAVPVGLRLLLFSVSAGSGTLNAVMMRGGSAMPISIEALGIHQLSVGERLELIEQIWNTLPEQVSPQEVPPWHLPELVRRLEDIQARPGAGKPWREVLGPLESRS